MDGHIYTCTGVMRLYLLAVSIAAAVLYGSTYQQFRFFNPDAPGGASDALHYIDMADGTPSPEPEIRHYRWLTAGAAALLRPATAAFIDDPALALRLAFYIVNYMFSLLASIALFATLQALGFSPLLSLLGVCAFASSRTISLVTGTPLVDAAYFCFIAALVYLVVAEKIGALAMLMPLFAIGKETIFPFMLLPLLTRFRSSRWLSAGYVVAAVVVTAKVQLVEYTYVGEHATTTAVVLEHVADMPAHASRLLTLEGLHDFQHGFSLLLPMAIAGAWLNTRHQSRRVPLVVVATVPIAFGLALLSGNLGRMFFAAFPAVITYALITVEHITSPTPSA